MPDYQTTESTGTRLSRNTSRRRVVLEGRRSHRQKLTGLGEETDKRSDDQAIPTISTEPAVNELQESKSSQAKSNDGQRRPAGYEEQAVLWHPSAPKRKVSKSEGSDSGSAAQSNPEVNAEPQGWEFALHATQNAAVKNYQADFVTRLVSVVGDVPCPLHTDRSIHLCPRECGWNLEEQVERGRTATHEAAKPSAALSTSTTLVPSLLQSEPSSTILTETQDQGKSSSTKVRPCYVLIGLGLVTIVGSLVPALWRASIRDDLSGGFTLAQYILGVGIFIVGSMVAIHSRTCTCWQSKG